MDAKTATESAVIIAFPAAEPVVQEFRNQMDPSAAWGVPAHVTVLYPFVPPEELTPAVMSEVEAIARATRRFEVRFAHTGWFGEQVLWLAPEPEVHLRVLTARLSDVFPNHLPYGGTIDTPIPHLTIAEGSPLARMQAAEDTILDALPIHTAATHLTVMTGRREPGTWTVRAEYSFDTTMGDITEL